MNTIPHQPGKGNGQFRCFFRIKQDFIAQSFHDIESKMGIHLSLQIPYFHKPFAFCQFFIAFHQLMDFPHHAVKFLINDLKFLQALLRFQPVVEIAIFSFPHSNQQTVERFQYFAGQFPRH